MFLASSGPLGGPLEDLLGRLGALLRRLEAMLGHLASKFLQDASVMASVLPRCRLGPILGPLGRPKTLIFLWFLNVFRLRRFSSQERPKTAQEVPKIVPRRPKRPPRERPDSPRRPQDGPRGLQDGLRRPQERPKRGPRGGAGTDISSSPPKETRRRPEEAPKRPQEAPTRPPGSPQRSPRGPQDCPRGPQDGRRRPDKASQRQTDNTGTNIMSHIGIIFFAVLFLTSHAHLSSKVGVRGNIRVCKGLWKHALLRQTNVRGAKARATV